MADATKKRKLPHWMMEKTPHEAMEAKDALVNAEWALEILERGAKERYSKQQDDLLLPNDDYDSAKDEDDEYFSLSQSSVADVMTSEEALELIVKKPQRDLLKYDRGALIVELRRAITEEKKTKIGA